MSGDMESAVVKAAAAGAALGGMARVLVALHGGQRVWVLLLIEAGLGAVLGLCSAMLALWWWPALRGDAGAWLIVSGFAGLSGALGTRLLDLVTRALEVRLPPGPKP